MGEALLLREQLKSKWILIDRSERLRFGSRKITTAFLLLTTMESQKNVDIQIVCKKRLTRSCLP
jgi:hypothetical protein